MRAVVDARQALRGLAKISAVSVVAELGEISRFAHPRQLMGYSGAVPREHSSGARVQRGSISKTGNAHRRRIVIEAAWAYRHRPGMGTALPPIDGQRQSQAESHHRCGARAAGVYLGHWCAGRALVRRGNPDALRGVTDAGSSVKQRRQRPGGHTERRIPAHFYVTGHMTGPTALVRGSSRRIATMTAGLSRSANIRVINRRISSPWPLSTLLHHEQLRHSLDRSFHIRSAGHDE